MTAAGDELKAYLLTQGAHYRGSLVYSEGAVVPRPRLLDFLNARGRSRTAAAQKSPGLLRIENVDALIMEAGSRVNESYQVVHVALGSVILAFDQSPPAATAAAPPTSYEKRMAQQVERVIAITRTRHRITGLVHGGLRKLTIRTPDEMFVAMTDVTFEDLADEGNVIELPFVALNMDMVEAFWGA